MVVAGSKTGSIGVIVKHFPTDRCNHDVRAAQHEGESCRGTTQCQHEATHDLAAQWIPEQDQRQTVSARKLLCTVFWDLRGVLLIDYVPRRAMVNADS
ncbi:hypothetical protein AVEN_12111-1 [Araneus ventricosus]|uniref:Uncharacterized protein n=1 Tax=Araneus ventricosus TaxID=182803 RepID=A0A4Y2QAM7_ARAVE|nr:hypothetical protein AVEN_12111-1 [Araneus ventricosus]